MYDLTQSEKLEHTRKALAESELTLIAIEKRLDELTALLRESVCSVCNGAGRVWKGNKIVGRYQDGEAELERIMILCPSCARRAKAQQQAHQHYLIMQECETLLREIDVHLIGENDGRN